MSRRRQREHGDLAERLQKRVEEGDYYEALQLYKTSQARLWQQAKGAEADDLLATGAIAMAQHNELNAANELGQALVDSFEEHKLEVNETALKLLQRISEAFPASQEQIIFLKRAIKFASGYPDRDDQLVKSLRLTLARSLAQFDDFGAAARQYAMVHETDEYGALLQTWSAKGYKSEQDLFACRAVLHLLTLNKRAEAAELWERLHQANPDGLSTKHTLVQFTVLVLALSNGLPAEKTEECASAFTLLKDKYAPVLARDPELEQMSTKIGEKFFGMQSQPGMGGFLGEIMSMFN